MADSSRHEPSHEAFELDMPAEEFRRVGYELVDLLADFYATIGDRPVTKAETVDRIRSVFAPRPLPEEGESAAKLLRRFGPLLLEHSLHNGHPRFFGYITSSAAPIGALADFLAAAINANCALRDISPAANEVERQTIAWLAELVGFPRPCGGIMVSGGNMANILAFFAARHERLPWPVRDKGLVGHAQPVVYASRGTHTWLEKAVDIAGMGTDAISWVETDRDHRLEIGELERTIAADRKAGRQPFLVIGTAGNVSTGAVDPLPNIAEIARREGLWFHVDGAYGAPAAMLPEAPDMLKALTRADSVALDPHKWLYNPIEAACTLVKDPAALANAFSYRPSYYKFDEKPGESGINYYEHGLQNTRSFRALKTWLCIQQAGRAGYTRRIRRDIALARSLYDKAMADPELEPGSHHLSITTFRYRPALSDMANHAGYLDRLNVRIIQMLAADGNVFVSNAVLDGNQFLRACIVNFRTEDTDIDTLARTVVRLGREADAAIRNEWTGG
jgi:glutamate/tyrosine decarboxylase-like PLP-dependent enzyme